MEGLEVLHGFQIYQIWNEICFFDRHSPCQYMAQVLFDLSHQLGLHLFSWVFAWLCAQGVVVSSDVLHIEFDSL